MIRRFIRICDLPGGNVAHMRVTVMQTDPAKQPWAFEADRITYTEHADGSLAIQVYAADGEPNGGAILPPGSWTGPIHEQP